MSANVDEDDAVEREEASAALVVLTTAVTLGSTLSHELSSGGVAELLSVATNSAILVISFGDMPSCGDVLPGFAVFASLKVIDVGELRVAEALRVEGPSGCTGTASFNLVPLAKSDRRSVAQLCESLCAYCIGK